MTAPGITPAPLPSGMTLDQWIADGRALLGIVDQYLPADVGAIVDLAGALLAAGAKAIEAPSPAAELTAAVDAEQTAAVAAVEAEFPSK